MPPPMTMTSCCPMVAENRTGGAPRPSTPGPSSAGEGRRRGENDAFQPVAVRARSYGMRIGFLGLGTMGAPLANNLRRAGHVITVWNRTAAKADTLVKKGA